MTPLSFVLIVSSILFLFFAIDGLQRRRFTAIHFVIFVVGIGVVLGFIFMPWLQDWFASTFGVARGSDVIVYATLMLLWYFYFELLHEVVKQKTQTTKIISADAIRSVWLMQVHHIEKQKDAYVFLIRAYNEWSVIGEVIESIINAWFSKIVIVNDGSQDDTIAQVEEKKKLYTNQAGIYILSHMINRGGWAANKTWLQFIQQYQSQLAFDRVVTYDADGQMDIDDMNSFMHSIKDPENHRIKAYLGSRFIEGGSASNMPRTRKLILRGSKIITRLFNRIDVSDPHNGYRVLHKDIVGKMYITSDGMAYASELLDSLRMYRISFKEIPVHIKYTDYSLQKLHGQKNTNAFKILMELIYKKIFFR